MKLANKLLEAKEYTIRDFAKEFNNVASSFVKPRVLMNTMANKDAKKVNKDFEKQFKDKADKISKLMEELEALVEEELFKR